MIKIHDKTFVPYIAEEAVQNQIALISQNIQKDAIAEGKTQVYFLGVLNGSFRLIADIIKHIHIPVEVGFLRVSSYAGTDTTGEIKKLMDLPADMVGKHVYIIEDIVDTGITLQYLIDEVKQHGVASCKVVTLLSKPSKHKIALPIDYIGFEIPDFFVVGYGLDYDGLGRELNGIYQILEK